MLITPYVGIGPISFGMSIDQVREAMGAEAKEFKKTASAVFPTDDFPTLGVHVYYTNLGICEAIEVASPAQPLLFGRELIGQPFDKLCEWLAGLDEQIKMLETGGTSFRFGIGLYVSDLKRSLNTPVEAVIVFRKGYYD
jgi:hypothetical protein